MRKFSFVSFFDDQFAFDRLYATKLIQRIIAKDSSCSFSPDDLIEDLKLSFSFWIDDSGTISFAHKSLQEYFCALYIHDLDSANRQTVYQRLRRKAGEVSDQFNILSILEEIDTCQYLEHYFLPVLTDLKLLLETSDSVSAFISSIFPHAWIMPDKVIHVRIAPGTFRFIQILDKKKDLFRELYETLREEVAKNDAFYVATLKPKKATRRGVGYQLEFKSAPDEIALMLNKNVKLLGIKKSFEVEVERLMMNAKEEIRIQKEIDEDILSMI